jgi:hypothetical protein
VQAIATSILSSLAGFSILNWGLIRFVKSGLERENCFLLDKRARDYPFPIWKHGAECESAPCGNAAAIF